MHRILKSIIRTPRQIVPVQDYVAQYALAVDYAHPLGDPLLAHHLGRMSPHLEVVRKHEVLSNALAEGGVDPLSEVAGITWLPLRFDQAQEALENAFSRQIPDVVLE